MGWMASWAAVQSVSDDVLKDDLQIQAVGLTGSDLGFQPGLFYVARMPDDWTVMFIWDLDWATPKRVRELSRHGSAIGLQFEDKVEMTAIACACEGGKELWRVSHKVDDTFQMEIVGVPPPSFGAIFDRHMQAQREADAFQENGDILYEIPHGLLKDVCGYDAREYDGAYTEWAPRPEQPKPWISGALASLFGRGTK